MSRTLVAACVVWLVGGLLWAGGGCARPPQSPMEWMAREAPAAAATPSGDAAAGKTQASPSLGLSGTAGTREALGRSGPAMPPREGGVLLPRTCMTATDALAAAHQQAGLRYAVLPPRFEGVVGPFELDRPVPPKTLLAQVAEATGTTTSTIAGVTVFQGRTPAGVDDRRIDELLKSLAYPRIAESNPPPAGSVAVSGVQFASLAGGVAATAEPKGRAQPVDPVAELFELHNLCQARLVVPLSRRTADRNERVRLMALRVLADLEGDFIVNEWPGRVSIFELLADELDSQSLLWAVEEGGPAGGMAWQQAVSVLGRARHRLLSRHTWMRSYTRDQTALHLSYWAIGRVADPSAAWSIQSKVAETYTNDPSDRFLVAMATGRLNPNRLLFHAAADKGVESRQAAAYGAGFAGGHSDADKVIEKCLADAEPTVRFLACLSAARVAAAGRAPGEHAWFKRLAELAGKAGAPLGDRSAALTALATIPGQAAVDAVLAAGKDPAAAIRVTAARLLGDIGGRTARDGLLELLPDTDRWVKVQALESLGRIGDARSVERVGQVLLLAGADPDARIAAAIGLGRGRNPAAAAVLTPVALDASAPKRLRQYALRALAQLPNRAGAETLKLAAALNSSVHDVMAVRYLDLATPAETANVLIPILTQGNRVDSAAAANRLAELGYGPGVRELLEGFDVFDNSARMMHMWGAIRAEGPSATQALIDSIASPRWKIRRSVALALGSRYDPAAVNALLQLTGDPEGHVRAHAAQSLGLTGDPIAIERLIEMAKSDPDLGASSEAIRALRRADWARRPEVVAAFAELAGSERDCGVVPARVPSLDNQPANSFVLRRWPTGIDDLSITNITYESSLTYDSGRGRVVQWGSHGRRADFPQTGQTWFYNAAANSWKRLIDSRQWPNGTCCVWGTTYDPANEVVIVPKSGHGGHGWVSNLRANLSNSVPWVMDATADQWRPAKPITGPGGVGLGQLPADFDTEHDVTIFWNGTLWAYDAYENRWDKLEPANDGPAYGHSGGWDPVGKRFIAVAPAVGGRVQTWAYDPATNRWTDLKAANGPAKLDSRLVYDSANDVMIGFAMGPNKRLSAWVFHPRDPKWEAMAAVNPAPRFSCFDTAYDSGNNVVVFSGGWESGDSGEATIRETWTYRYRPADPAAPARLKGRIAGLKLETEQDGRATLSWTPLAAAQRYRILRGAGDRPWRAAMAEIGSPTDKVIVSDSPPGGGDGCYFYRVEALDADGKVLARSRLARTIPAAVTEAWAVVTSDGIQVGWTPSANGDVIGYRVYRGQIDLGNPWMSDRFDAEKLEGSLRLVSGDNPVSGAGYLDKMAEPAALASELSWPRTMVYVVRPVNRWGRLGGPSPATAAIPDAPGPVRVVPWADGRRLVIWTPPPGAEHLAGFHLLRMDDWHGESVYRCNGGPILAVGFLDTEEFPTAERRRYYVVGADANGTLGVPSSGAWSHGFP